MVILVGIPHQDQGKAYAYDLSGEEFLLEWFKQDLYSCYVLRGLDEAKKFIASYDGHQRIAATVAVQSILDEKEVVE